MEGREPERKLRSCVAGPSGEQIKAIRIVIAVESELVRRRVRSILCNLQTWRIAGEPAAEVDLPTMANEQTPGVAIMDTVKPVLGGLDAAKKILKIRPRR
jgi:two-component system invasion response regulator UvrY